MKCDDGIGFITKRDDESILACETAITVKQRLRLAFEDRFRYVRIESPLRGEF